MAEPRPSDATNGLCCHLVYALAPQGLDTATADDLFNSYLAQSHRGVIVHHDHFLDRPGAFAVIAASTPQHLDALADPGPLAGWTVSAHPLTFSPDTPGFYVQGDSTLRRFSFLSLDQAPSEAGRCHEYTARPLPQGDPGRYS